MTSDQSEVAFNLQGRLRTVTGASSASEYTYDDSGIRVSQAVTTGGTTTTTLHVVDNNNPTGYAQVLEEKASTGTPTAATLPTRTYTLGHDVLAQVDGASAPVRVLLKDGHGSTRQLVDATGQVLAGQVFTYQAYGEAIGFDPATAETSIQYSGQWFEVSVGMQYLRARWYSPDTGRLMSFDPYAGNMQDPLSLHKYLYTHANPIMGVDPTGLFEGLVGVAVGNSIGSIISQMNVSAGQSLISSLGVEDSIDLFDQAVGWIWDKLPASVRDAINHTWAYIVENAAQFGFASSVVVVAGAFAWNNRSFLARVRQHFDELLDPVAKRPGFVHDEYVQYVRPGARQKTFKWSSEGRLGSRKFDDFDYATGTAFEGNTTPWEQLTDRKLQDKLDQVGADIALLRENREVKRVIWFGTEPLPSSGRAGQLRQALEDAGIEYWVVVT
jgi:RHS repeat-associated protein